MEQNDDTSTVIDADLIRIPAKDAASIATAAGLDDDAMALLQKDDTPKAYLERLLRAKRDGDALAFIAFALPKREVIWWACVSLRRLLGGAMDEEDDRALQIAEAWVFEPSQQVCETAGALAEKKQYLTSPALVAASVYWAGDTMAPPDCPRVPPREDLTHKGVLSAINLHLVTKPDEAVRDRLGRVFLSTGIRIAQGATSKAALLANADNGPLWIEAPR